MSAQPVLPSDGSIPVATKVAGAVKGDNEKGDRKAVKRR
jgi:hypothetical protein